jgi:hypothetical protein
VAESIQHQDQIFALNQAWVEAQWGRIPGPGVGTVTAPVVWQKRLYIFSYSADCDCLAYNVLQLQEIARDGEGLDLPITSLFNVWGIWRLLEGESSSPLSAAVLGETLHLFRRQGEHLFEARFRQPADGDGSLGKPTWERLEGFRATGPDSAGPVALAVGDTEDELCLFAFGAPTGAGSEPSLYRTCRGPEDEAEADGSSWTAPWGPGLTGTQLAGAVLKGEPILFRVDENRRVEELRSAPHHRAWMDPAPPAEFTGLLGAAVFAPQQEPAFEPVLHLYAPTSDGRILQNHRRHEHLQDGAWRSEWRLVPSGNQAPEGPAVLPTLPTAALHRGSLFLFYGITEGFQRCLVYQPVDVDLDLTRTDREVTSRPDRLVQRRGVSALVFTLYGEGEDGPARFSAVPFRQVTIRLGDSATAQFRMRPLPFNEEDGAPGGVRQYVLANFNNTRGNQTQSVSFHFAVEADGRTYLSPDPTVFDDPEEFEG